VSFHNEEDVVVMKRTMWVVAVLLVVGSQPAWAARLRVHEMAESQQYGRKAGGMLGRGLLNVVTSPVDVLVNTVNETKAGPPFVGTLTGLGRGVGCGVLRLGSGAVDVVTFWVPGFNGFPVSDSYENCFSGSASTAVMEQTPAGYGQPAAAWDVPTAEPGAAQAPAEPAQPKRTWKK
jgi:putative exosortase-associated protein (TIGR04073 family)